MDPLASRIATRYLASSTVTVYHGTTGHNAAKIKSRGLVSPMGYDRAQWYMVAADFESAAFHAGKEGSGPEVGGNVVLELRIPTEPKVLDDGSQRNMWPGFPYLWRGENINWEGSPTKWYALRQPLPDEFIRKSTRVEIT